MDYNEITNRIDELNLDGYKHIKQNDWGIPDKLTSWLEEKGFELEGEGVYSKVFKSPTENFVVKVNKGHIDRGYLSFVEFCHKNKGNPHLPKMGQIKKYDDWYIIFIEKLDYTEDGYDGDDVAYNIEQIAFGQKADLSSFKKKIQKQIFKAGTILKKYVSEYNKQNALDLHGENIMMRGDTIVITDPVV